MKTRRTLSMLGVAAILWAAVASAGVWYYEISDDMTPAGTESAFDSEANAWLVASEPESWDLEIAEYVIASDPQGEFDLFALAFPVNGWDFTEVVIAQLPGSDPSNEWL